MLMNLEAQHILSLIESDVKKHHSRAFSTDEKLKIISTYLENKGKKNGWLQKLSIDINRPKSNISRFVKNNSIDGIFGTSRTRKELEAIVCIICNNTFIPKNKKQKACNLSCGVKLNVQLRTGGHIWKDKEHPRGMLGKQHSKAFSRQQSIRLSNRWKDKNDILNSDEHKQKQSDRMSIQMTNTMQGSSNTYSRTKKGWIDFKSGKRYFFRSGWEMNYARYLEWLMKKGEIKNWEYERETFWFENIRRGVRSYTPDFFITNNNGSEEIHEVKGWLDAKSKTKLARMAKYYPKVKLVLIGESEYKALAKWGKMIGFE